MRHNDASLMAKMKELVARLKGFAKRYRSQILMACASIITASIVLFIKTKQMKGQKDAFEARIDELEARISKERAKHAEARNLFSQESERVAELKAKLFAAKERQADIRKQFEASVLHAQDVLNQNRQKVDGLLRSQIEFFNRSKNFDDKAIQSAKYIIKVTRKQSHNCFNEAIENLGSGLYL